MTIFKIMFSCNSHVKLVKKDCMFTIYNFKSVIKSNSHLLYSRDFKQSLVNLSSYDMLDLWQRLKIKRVNLRCIVSILLTFFFNIREQPEWNVKLKFRTNININCFVILVIEFQSFCQIGSRLRIF